MSDTKLPKHLRRLFDEVPLPVCQVEAPTTILGNAYNPKDYEMGSPDPNRLYPSQVKLAKDEEWCQVCHQHVAASFRGGVKMCFACRKLVK